MELLEDCYAWERLHDPHLLARLDAEGLLDVAKRAGMSEQAAAKWVNECLWQRMRRENPT